MQRSSSAGVKVVRARAEKIFILIFWENFVESKDSATESESDAEEEAYVSESDLEIIERVHSHFRLIWWVEVKLCNATSIRVLRAVLTNSANSCPPERLLAIFNATYNVDQKSSHANYQAC